MQDQDLFSCDILSASVCLWQGSLPSLLLLACFDNRHSLNKLYIEGSSIFLVTEGDHTFGSIRKLPDLKPPLEASMIDCRAPLSLVQPRLEAPT